jgi:hypothetical protein
MPIHCNLDIINNSDKTLKCSQKFDFPQGLLEGPSKHYKVICAKADYDLSDVPMYYNPENIEFTIRESGHPENILSTFVLEKGFYNSVQELLARINFFISSVGVYQYNTDTNKLEYKYVGDNTKSVYLPYKLYHLLEGFDYSKVNINGKIFFVNHEKSTEFVSQYYSTVDRFYNRSSIKVYAYGLTQKPHFQNSNIIGYHMNELLTDQVLAGEIHGRLIYIPTQFREIELTGMGNIYSFSIQVKVEYIDGSEFEIDIAPGARFSTLLLFDKI